MTPTTLDLVRAVQAALGTHRLHAAEARLYLRVLPILGRAASACYLPPGCALDLDDLLSIGRMELLKFARADFDFRRAIGVNAFEAGLFARARWAMLQQLQREARRAARPTRVDAPEGVETPEGLLARQETAQAVLNAVCALPAEEMRVVKAAHGLEGKRVPLRAQAARSNRPLTAVWQAKQRGEARLRVALREIG